MSALTRVNGTVEVKLVSGAVTCEKEAAVFSSSPPSHCASSQDMLLFNLGYGCHYFCNPVLMFKNPQWFFDFNLI